ncbi:MAG: hypothetical protein JWO73_57 [Candidatus Taylorbacteria bacterium]|nr:hypothetical protein [Candidatus Taylorbacteria bacterium]
MKKIKQITSSLLAAFVASLIVAGVAYAGSLTAPSGIPEATSYTLGDIYSKLTTNATTSAGDHLVSKTTSPAPSLNTLTQIYEAIPTIDATRILSGTTYLGVAGTASAGYEYPSAPLKTGQTTCYDTSGVLVSCAGTGLDGEFQKGIAASYSDNGDGTITDNLTGLIWQKCSAGLSGTDCSAGDSTFMTSAAAVAVCESLALTGQADWRLPNIRELLSIMDYSVSNPSTNSTYFPNTMLGAYWSSSAYANHPTYSWLAYFDRGDTGYDDRTSPGSTVRCVR